MLFPERKSGLVRLSDGVKIGLEICGETSLKVLDIYSQGQPHYSRAGEVADRAARGELDIEQADEQMREILSEIPLEVAKRGVAMQLQLHSQALSTILMCCFCLESYINSFAYFLLKGGRSLDVSGLGRQPSTNARLDAFNRLSTRVKWEAVGKLGGGSGFDQSKIPFRDFRILFNFRDDHGAR